MARGKGVFRFRVEIDPSPIKIAKILGGLGKDFKNWKPAFERIAPSIVAGFAANIRSRGAAFGEPWGPLDQGSDYLRRKVREGKGRAELFASGALMRDITTISKDNPKITARSLRYGTHLPYAAAVNFGSKSRRGKGGKGKGIKRRVFRGWSDSMKASALREMNDHAKELLSRAAQQINRARAI